MQWDPHDGRCAPPSVVPRCWEEKVEKNAEDFYQSPTKVAESFTTLIGGKQKSICLKKRVWNLLKKKKQKRGWKNVTVIWNLPECRRLSEKFAEKNVKLPWYVPLTSPGWLKPWFGGSSKSPMTKHEWGPWGCYEQVASDLGDLCSLGLVTCLDSPPNCVVQNGCKNRSGKVRRVP